MHPKIILDPLGDRLLYENKKNSKRGAEIYYPPNGWIRYGLKVSLIFKNLSWLTKDGNSNEWAVVYSGFKGSPLKTELSQKLIDPMSGKFRPHLKNSNNLDFSNVKDINPKSENCNKPCGIGIICSAKPNIAESKTTTFSLNGTKYKMLLQCRGDPVKMRIPQSNQELRIFNSPDHVRPYGILIKQI